MKDLIDKDIYWGEFPEGEMDDLLALSETKGFGEAREALRRMGRESFVLGKVRSDFIYYLDIDKESVCLDCGCGLGVHTFNMADRAKEVHAFDQSLKRLKFVEQRKDAEGYDNVSLYHSDFAHLPFKDGTFDVIIMNGVVEWLGEINAHTNPRDDQLAVLRQLYALLKPGGRLYIGIENRWALAYLRGYDHNGLRFTNFMPRFLADRITRWRKGKSYRTYTYGRQGYEKLLEESGFDRNAIAMHIVHPGYNLPKLIVPFDDTAALSFMLSNFSGGKGFKGKIMRFAAKIPLFIRVLRHFSWSFAIVATKK